MSELAGVSNPYLSHIERGLRKPSADILQQLARALHVSAETLYVQAGILDPRDGPEPALEREILRAPSPTHSQKQAMIEVYRPFHREGPGHPNPTAACAPTR